MDRRHFIKGLLEATTATSLIIAAKPEDIVAFTGPRFADIGVDDIYIAAPMPEPQAPNIRYGDILFNYKGEPVCVIDDIRIDVESMDMTPMGGRRVYSSGIKTVRITGIVTGHTKIAV